MDVVKNTETDGLIGAEEIDKAGWIDKKTGWLTQGTGDL
jgi:hypothetical protein